MKRRRVCSEEDRVREPPISMVSSSLALPDCRELKSDHQEALTPTSTSDTETRDSSLIDPGTEQDPPSPDPNTSENLDSSLKEEKIEASSSSSSSSSFSSSSSLLQDAAEGFVQGEEPEPQQLVVGTGKQVEVQLEGSRDETISTSSEELKEEKEAGSKTRIRSSPPLSEDTAFPSALGLVGEGPDCCGSHTSPSKVSPHDVLDMLYRTVEATVAIVTKLYVKGPSPS